jgi:FdhD protein
MPKGPVRSISGTSVDRRRVMATARALPEEEAVAIVCNGATQAVMMATPQDLQDFAVGFALTEGYVAGVDEIEGFEAVEHPQGIEARLWIDATRAEALGARRRAMAGPVGCGLCGIESLAEAARALPRVPASALRLSPEDVAGATEALRGHQPLHDQTRAVHAAGFLRPGEGIVLAREDVGRHNALDKLIGALARAGIDPAAGAFVLTSRVSVEMVQKCAMAGCPVLIAVSAPTAHAVRLAEGAGITLAAFARGTGFDLFTHPGRIAGGEADVA